MFKRFLLILCLLWMVGLVTAQDNFDEEYLFVDGTVVNFPSDFLIISEDYDQMTMVNERTEIRFFIVYERTILSRELDTLPDILDWWWGDSDTYDQGDEEAMMMAEREGIQFTYENSDDVEVLQMVVPIGENGSVAIVSALPNIENGAEIIEDTGIVFSIVETLRFEDLGGAFETVLGNSITVDDTWMIEYPDPWLANSIEQTLTLDETSITVSVYSADEITALELKNDPIELLYYDLFAPLDETVIFDPENIDFITIRGLEGIRYRLQDTVNDELIQHVYFLAPLTDTDILALDITASRGANILENSDVQDMIQTIRLDGTLPPIEMMSLERTFLLEGVGTVSFPEYWLAIENDNGTVTLSTLDTSVFIVPISADISVENNYPDDLVAALLNIVSPLDDSVILNVDDVETGSLQNGNRFAETTYIESNEVRSYPRTVMVVLLDDDSLVFIGLIPQPGIETISESDRNQAIVIINTIAP